MTTIKGQVLALTFILISTLLGLAQTEKGGFIAGGNFSFSTEEIDRPLNNNSFNQKITTFNINPSVSYFVIDQLSIGLSLPINYSKIEQSQGSEIKLTSYLIGPSVRYYFNFDKFSVFPALSYSLGKQITDGLQFNPAIGNLEDVRNETAINQFDIGVGLALFLNQHVALEGVLNYRKLSRDSEIETVTDLESYRLAFNVGLQFYF